MQRVSVVGVSGAGKSHLAEQVAARLGAPHIELDALFHQPGWEPADPDEFVASVRVAIHGESWVTDGNYRIAAMWGPIWEQADTVVWLDLPRWLVMRQVVARTLGRALNHTELWNGNRESPRNMLRWDPHRSIIRWAWTSYPRIRAQYLAAMDAPEYAHLDFVHLTSHDEARRWLASLNGTGSEHGVNRT